MNIPLFPSAVVRINIDKKTVLTKDILCSIKWFCLNDGKLDTKSLTKEQIKTIAQFMVSEAETYSSGHSMRYTIMKDFVRALGLIQ